MVVTFDGVWEAGCKVLARLNERQHEIYGPVVAALSDVEARWPWSLRAVDEDVVDMVFAAAMEGLVSFDERREISRLYGEVMERMMGDRPGDI